MKTTRLGKCWPGSLLWIFCAGQALAGVPSPATTEVIWRATWIGGDVNRMRKEFVLTVEKPAGCTAFAHVPVLDHKPDQITIAANDVVLWKNGVVGKQLDGISFHQATASSVIWKVTGGGGHAFRMYKP